MPDEQKRPDRSPSSPHTAPAVRLDHVTKAFGTKRVLNDVSFDVPAGCGYIVLGRSGTG